MNVFGSLLASSQQKLPPTERESLVATQLEVSFVAEMLKSIGVGSSAEGFDGGIGEEQFQSFLREQQAQIIVKNGGLGLAEHFLRTIAEAPK